jgi:hypothetical protein
VADVVDDVEQMIKEDILIAIGTDPSGELAALALPQLLITYLNWRMRFIPAIPRQAHLSSELLASPKYLEHRAAIDEIVRKIQVGEGLTSHLSNRVNRSYTPTAERKSQLQYRQDLDLLLAEWGIHHLHFLAADGSQLHIPDLLFASFKPADAFLIGVFDHKSWSDREVARICVTNWPQSGIFHEVHGVVGLAQQFTDDEHALIHNAGGTSFLEIDGKVYVPPGQTMAGTPTAATADSNQVAWSLRRLRTLLHDEPEELESILTGAGVDVAGGFTWKAAFEGGRYGIRDEHTGAFVCAVGILDLVHH